MVTFPTLNTPTPAAQDLNMHLHVDKPACFSWSATPLCVAGNEAVAVWRCLLLPDSHKHKQQEQPSQQQLLQQLRQLRVSASPADGAAGSNPAAAAAEAPGLGAAGAAGGCVWAIFMLRGGHFAAAVVKINSSSSSKSKSRQQLQQPDGSSSSSEAQQGPSSSSQAGGRQQGEKAQQGLAAPYPAGSEPFSVLVHKTFHRYVVRWVTGVSV
jgi:hypothetical protein